MRLSEANLRTQRAMQSVLNTILNQSSAVDNMHLQYKTDLFSQSNLTLSLDIMYDTVHVNGGKVVVCGIGKSFKIANKLVATLNSLSCGASALHPSEALHGDLGLINQSKDCLLLLTASGNTPELLQLLPHLSPSLPIILLTCSKNSKLSNHPQVSSLLYANLPTYLNEDSIHGLPAPTVLATLLLILADATILALLEMIEQDKESRKRLFATKHPGGSIGANLSHLNNNLYPTKSSTASKKSFSLQVSSSSLLSLNQIRNSFDPFPCSVESSGNSSGDDNKSINSLTSSYTEEDSPVFKNKVIPLLANNIESALTQLIRLTNAASCLKVSFDDILNIHRNHDELKLLQWTALYKVIIYETNSHTHAVATATILDFYRRLTTRRAGGSTESEAWNQFNKDILDSFQEVLID